MRTTAMAFLLCLASSVANAETFRYMHPAVCDKLDVVVANIVNEWNEKMTWSGQDIQDGSGWMLFENPKEKTWTFIKYNKEVACVIGVGTNSAIKFGEPV